MANTYEMTEEQKKGWHSWASSRPLTIRELCLKFRPNKLYRLISTGHRCTLYSFSEDGTISVMISGRYNKVVVDEIVFGVKPEGLEECDLPEKGEELGTEITDPEELKVYIEKLKKLKEDKDDGS